MNNDLIINRTATILDAIKKIDLNQKKFLIVVANDMTVCGTLTDGDIRRALLQGFMLNDAVADHAKSDCIKLYYDSSVSEAVELFHNSKISFLPIVDYDSKLVNIITEQHLKNAFIQNLRFDLSYDFDFISDDALKHSIVAKPWGFYHTMVISDLYLSKVISLNPASSISMQLHKYREEYWVVVSGNGEAHIADSIKQLQAGAFVFIPMNCKHRLRNASNDNDLVVIEVQLGERFDEDDIERFDDEYNR